MLEIQPRGRTGAPGQVGPQGSEALIRLRPRAVVWLLGLVAAMLGGLSIGQHLLSGADPPIGRMNLDTEGSVPTWFQASMLLLAAGLTGLVGVARSRASDRYARHWLMAAGILVFLSMDEALAFHEMLIDPLRDALGASGIFYFAWVIPGAVVVVLFASAYLGFLLSLPTRMQRLLIFAGGFYIAGGLGVEAADGAYASAFGLDNLGYTLLTDFEEVMEMAGLLVLIYALLWFLSTLRVSIRFDA